MTTIAVTVALFNEEKNIKNLIESLLNQTRTPDEIILVDDGSIDNTFNILNNYFKKYSNILKIFRIKNSGPAYARNIAWKNSLSKICLFTDGDCIPKKDWIEKIEKTFQNNISIAAVAGRYKTLNSYNLLANFIGEEIAWKYKNVRGVVDVHGTYSLAVRKDILKEVNGFNESYKKPSGEDWDLTYKISSKYKIIYNPDVIVGHFHPEKFLPYLINQFNRSCDRIKIYNDHPEKRNGDVYTASLIKYQILGSGILILTTLLSSTHQIMKIITKIIFILLLTTYLFPFKFFLKKNYKIAFFSIFIQFIRSFFWGFGILKGILKFGYKF